MDARLTVGLAAVGVAAAGTVLANHLLGNKVEDRTNDSVAERRDRAQHQREGGLKLEYAARGGSAMTDFMNSQNFGLAQFGTVVGGVGLTIGGFVAAMKGPSLLRPIGAGAIGAVIGTGIGAVASSLLLSRQREISVDEVATDIMAVADADDSGSIELAVPYGAEGYDRDQKPENRLIQQLHYDDPMDFIGTQSPEVDWRAGRLQQHDSNKDNHLDAAEVQAMTASFDHDGNGDLSHSEAEEMAVALNLQTWKGTERTGMDKSSWKTSGWAKDGYR